MSQGGGTGDEVCRFRRHFFKTTLDFEQLQSERTSNKQNHTHEVVTYCAEKRSLKDSCVELASKQIIKR